MRKSTLLVATLALVAGLAGCLDNDEPNANPTPTPAQAFNAGTWPSGQNARDYIESYVMTHPFRAEQPGFEGFMESARGDLEAILNGTGTHVMRHEYDGGTNILAFKNGTVNPDQWVVLSAHYDVIGVRAGGIGPTVYGAWDDGSGTASLIELAHAFADWDFPFTVVYAFFDGEEKGLVGSRAFVDHYYGNGEVDILANLNTDPPGLNWPCGDQTGDFAVKIIHNQEKLDAGELPRYTWLNDAIDFALNASGVPAEVIDKTAGIPIAQVAGIGLSGTSDHASFDAVDVANVFIGGIPATIVNGDANDNTAAVLTYSFHTPLDTLEQMEARCTVGSLSEGLQTTVDLFAHGLSELARTA